tara:strand:+ start:254 stop:415 length:162 start_codon:yes stop_codon:yes gene_type:complete
MNYIASFEKNVTNRLSVTHDTKQFNGAPLFMGIAIGAVLSRIACLCKTIIEER